MNAPTPAGAFLWDPRRLRIVEADRAALAFWGEATEEALRRRVFAPEDANARALSAALAALGEAAEQTALTLHPGALPRAVFARLSTEERAGEGRAGGRRLRVRIDGAAPETAPAALALAGFEAAPRPLALFAKNGAPVARNAADIAAFGPAPEPLAARYTEPGAAEAALAAARAAGAFSHPAALRGFGPARVTLRLLPAEGGEALLLAEITEEEEPGAAGFVAAVAHDLRGPLGAILGMAEFLAAAGETMGPERRAAYLADILTASRRMEAMIEGLVSAPAADAEARFDLRALADEAARGRQPVAEAAGVALSVSGPEEAEARGDETAALRILGNLIDNALEHGARPGGAVRVTLAPGEGENGPTLEIADDGPGLDETALAVALTPGGRPGESAPARSGGLGLPNARALAEEIGARLDIETAPGAGFAARLTFPPPGPPPA
ncbi:MAG: sensor histidine kinase [Pikeienuella sp.]|uniref:sensor histidine kinase n=1 Tax=Pikeienuella sp. TaxID=2831957 RepID=UPI00391C2B1F